MTDSATKALLAFDSTPVKITVSCQINGWLETVAKKTVAKQTFAKQNPPAQTLIKMQHTKKPFAAQINSLALMRERRLQLLESGKPQREQQPSTDNTSLQRSAENIEGIDLLNVKISEFDRPEKKKLSHIPFIADVNSFILSLHTKPSRKKIQTKSFKHDTQRQKIGDRLKQITDRSREGQLNFIARKLLNLQRIQ